MPYRLAADEAIDTGLRRIFLEEIAKVRKALDDESKPAERRIFKARKRLKRARSVVRLLKAPLGSKTQARITETLRGVSRALAPARDADALAATAGQLAQTADPEHRDIYLKLVLNLENRAAMIRSNSTADIEFCRSAMRAAEADAQRAPLRFPAETVLETAFRRAYGRGRVYRRIAVQTGRAEAFHDWRKYVKQRWHLSLLVRELRGEDFAGVVARLAELGKLLGSDHDYAVLEALCRLRPGLVGPVRHRLLVRDAIRNQQRMIRNRALAPAADLYDETIDAAVNRFKTACRVAQPGCLGEPAADPVSGNCEVCPAE